MKAYTGNDENFSGWPTSASSLELNCQNWQNVRAFKAVGIGISKPMVKVHFAPRSEREIKKAGGHEREKKRARERE